MVAHYIRIVGVGSSSLLRSTYMIKNIIFDLGGVILTHKKTLVEDILSKIFNIPVEDAKSHYLKYKDDLRTGKIDSTIFITQLRNDLKSTKSVSELLKEWEQEYKNIAYINNLVLELIDELHKNYSVYLMTDTIDLHDRYNSQRGIYNHFKYVIKSNEEGVKKPDARAFLNMLQKIDARANECCFIDDLKENIIAARKLGMKGIIYKNVTQLKQDLERIGLNI